MISVVLVGLSVTALVVASNSFTTANGAGADLSTAEFLIEQIRELTTLLPVADPDVGAWTALGPEADEPNLAGYNDVDDFDGASFCPPISASKTVLADFADWRQQITVDKLNPSNFNQVWADNTGSSFVRVTVHVSLNGEQVSSASWVRARY